MWSEKGVFTFLFCAFGKWSKKDSGERSENVHIHEFADCCEFAQEAIGGTIPATQEYRDFVKNLHSKQILNMQVIIPFYEVRFQYETIRKNLRTGKKYFFASNGEHEDIDLEIGMKLENSVDYEKKLQENAIFRKYHWLIFDRSDLRFCVFSGIMYWD